MIKLKIHFPEGLKQKLNEVYSRKHEILAVGGQALRKVLADHVRMLAQTRHKSSMKLGVPPSGHWKASDVGMPIVQNDTVFIPMYTPGITRALHDVTIRPKTSKNLAMPINRLTMGLGAKEFGLRGGQKLFFYLTKSGNKSLATNANGSLLVMYILKSQVHQLQDPTLLPEDEKMNKAFFDAVAKSISTIIHAG